MSFIKSRFPLPTKAKHPHDMKVVFLCSEALPFWIQKYCWFMGPKSSSLVTSLHKTFFHTSTVISKLILPYSSLPFMFSCSRGVIWHDIPTRRPCSSGTLHLNVFPPFIRPSCILLLFISVALTFYSPRWYCAFSSIIRPSAVFRNFYCNKTNCCL